MPEPVTLYPEARERLGVALEASGFNQVHHPIGRWEGELDVDWIDQESGERRRSKHGASIDLDSGFPFKKPEVTPLSELDGGARHRAPIGSGGALCLYSERQRGWLPSTTGQELLDRIREWFVHYHQDDWGVDDRPPDLHLYYRRTKRGYLAVYGEDWLPPEGRSGRFALAEGHTVILVSNPTLGAIMPSAAPQERLSNHLGISKPSSVGLWFRLDNEPTPCESLGEALRDIDSKSNAPIGSAQKGIRDLIGVKVRREIRTIIAIGYPGMSGEEWLFLDVILPTGKTRATQWERRLREIRIRALEAAPATPQALLRRTRHTQTQLDGKSALIFGLGSLGSSIAMLLAKAGIPRLVGVDDDHLRPSNCIRHEAGMRLSGFEKTAAMHYQVGQHAPDCEFKPISGTWKPDILSGLARSTDLIIDATANEAFGLLLNEIAVRSGTPLIQAVTFRRAALGRARIVFPRQTACIVCYLGLEREPGYPIIPPGEEGAFVEGGCGDPTVEASALDISLCAAHVARIARDILVGTTLAGSEVIIVNSSEADLVDPLNTVGVHWREATPVPECEVCGAR